MAESKARRTHFRLENGRSWKREDGSVGVEAQCGKLIDIEISVETEPTCRNCNPALR